MRVAIYIRVSTSDGRQDTTNQKMQLEALARREGWKVSKVYEDNASGKSAERAEFQKMLADAERRRFDILLFWSLDRFSRQGAYPTLQLLNRISELGIHYRSFTEQYIDSCGIFRDAIISILATIAKQERIRLSERTRAGLARQKAAGSLGPNGHSGPGKPRAEFDEKRARSMKAAGASLAQIALAVGASKATLSRFFRK